MSRLKKKQNISGGYKPLVAASLAVALGVSVASATNFVVGTAVDADVTIDAAQATVDGTTTTSTGANGGVAGIAVIPSPGTATVTLNNDVTIAAIANSTADKNAYGIFVNGAVTTTNDATFTGNHTITIAAPTVVAGTGKTYIYANEGASVVSFTGGARLVAGTLPTRTAPTNFGIYSALDGASYAFGSTTGKTIFDAGTAAADTAGAAYTGMIINNNTTLAGNVDVVGQTGGTATAAGKNGGDTIGISIDATAKRTITANALVLSVKGGAGSNGNTPASDPKGIGGSATGLSIAGNKGVDIAGAIRLNLAAGADGAQGTTPTDSKVKTLTAIDNKMTTDAGVLTFKSGSSLTVKSTAVAGNHGIHNEIANVVYNFGSDAAKTVFEAVGSRANSDSSGAAGAGAIGLNLAQAATLGGNLVFTSIQGQDGGQHTSNGDGGAGGTATGIVLVGGQNIALNNANITFTNIAAGNGGITNDFTGHTGGAGGTATGISLASGDVEISGNGVIAFTNINKGLGGTKTTVRGTTRAGNGANGNAYVINNAGTGTLTFSGNSLVAGTPANDLAAGTFGIYNQLADANYVFGNGSAGNAGTVFTIQSATGAIGSVSGSEVNNGQSGADAVGIVMAGDLSHSGYLKQTITGAAGGAGTVEGANGGDGADGYGLVFEGNSTYTIADTAANKLELIVAGGNGGVAGSQPTGGAIPTAGAKGNAYGIVSKTANAALVIGTGASATISAKAGTGSSGGEAVGILVEGTTSADRTVTQSKLTLSGTGSLALTVGDATNTTKAYGLKLENGVFAGSLEFDTSKSTITVKDGAGTNNKNTLYGIHASGESTIESGILTFATAGLVGANHVDKYVLFNDAQGTLTLGKDVKIKTGSTNDTAVISNEFDDTFYAFGGNTQVGGGDATAAEGTDFIGFDLAGDATLSGKLSVLGGNAGGNETRTPGDGYAGGDATGISFTADSKTLTIADSGLTLNVTGGNATTAVDPSTSNGIAGKAMGIHIDAAATTSATISGGQLNLILANGKVGATASDTAPVAIDNAGKLVIDNNGILVGAVDTAPTTQFGIYNAQNAVYSFGTTSVKNTTLTRNLGTQTQASEDVAASNGADIQGIVLTADATMSGFLNATFTAQAGQAAKSGATTNKNGGKGGDATALYANNGTALTIDVNPTTSATISLSAVAGDGGTGATGGSKGDKGNAYGIKTAGDFTLIINSKSGSNEAGSLSLAANGKKAYGIYLAGAGKSTGGSVVNIANDISLGTLAISSSSTSAGAIQGEIAHGIHNAQNAWSKLDGTITFGEAANVAMGSADSTEVHGIHNEGKLELDGGVNFTSSALAAKSGVKKIHLYNAGDMTFGAASCVSVGSDSGANLFADASTTLNVALADNSTTTFKGGTAIDASATSGVVDITMGKNSTAIFEQNAFGTTGGEINLTLNGDTGKTAKLIFNGAAGTVAKLTGSNADIFLAGADAAAVKARFEAKAPFAGRTLQAKEADLDKSHIVLAAKSTSMLTPNSPGTFTGKIIDSDRIVVDADATSATEVRNNTLHVTVDQYVTEVAENPSLAILAVTTKDSKVVFNDLKTDKAEGNATVYGDFTNGEIKIVRYDDATTSKTYYVSDLRTTNISVNTDFVAPATAALSAGVSLFSANLNSLSKRMGELRNDPYSQGAWARVFGGEQTTNFGAKQSTVYSTVQAGYDYKLALGDAANYIGAAISYTKGMGGQVDPAYKQIETPISMYVPGLSSSNTDGVEVALYNSYVANSGLYSDSIVKFGYYMNDLTMFGQTDAYSTSNLAVAVSEEIGYKVSLGESNEWFITPQGEVAFAYIGGTDFTQSNGADSLKSTQDAVSLLRARVGAAWGYDFSYLAKESDVKASIYLGTYYAYDYFIGGDTTLTAVEKGITSEYKHNAYEGTGRFVMNLGTNIDVQDRTKVYFDFEKSFGGNIQTDYQVSLGVRFGFGEKVSAPKQEEKKATEAALKPKELDESAE